MTKRMVSDTLYRVLVQVTVDWKAKHSSETHKAVEWVRLESVPVCLKRTSGSC